MTVDWPPFPSEVAMLDHPATEEDLAAGRAAFIIRDGEGQSRGRPVPMGMSRLGFVKGEDGPRLGVAVQVEAAGDLWTVAVLHSDGTFTICGSAEFDSAGRCLVLFDKPDYTLESLERDWAARSHYYKLARRGSTLAVQQRNGPILFVRYATGQVVKDEVRLIRHERAAEMERCTALFEVSFVNFDETLNEINSLLIVQEHLQEATGGYLYLEWNGRLWGPGEV